MNPDASTLPSTATPSAPPACRVVSFMAEPTPAFSFGTEPMIDSVADGIAIDIPPDMHTRPRAMWTYEESARTVARISSPHAPPTSPKPDEALRAEALDDARRDRCEHHEHDRDRQQPDPGLERVEAEDELQHLGHDEHRARDGEEGHGHRDVGHGEARVAEEREVEHRLVAVHLPERERGDHDDRSDEPRDGAGAAPAAVGSLDDRPQQEREPDHRQQRADGIEARCARVA